VNGETTVRRASADDAPAVFAVMRASRRAAFEGLVPPSALDWDEEVTPEFVAFVRELVAGEKSALLVAERAGTVVGVAELVWDDAETAAFVAVEEGELRSIHVHPDRWGEGVGTALLAAATTVLARHCEGVALAVLTENERARGFYEGHGFERDGTRTREMGAETITEAVYRRSLS
jgi:ribosomal protein S18 acetylase RimI-like enzyme